MIIISFPSPEFIYLTFDFIYSWLPVQCYVYKSKVAKQRSDMQWSDTQQDDVAPIFQPPNFLEL